MLNLLEYGWFIMLYKFQLCRKVIQLCQCIYLFSNLFSRRLSKNMEQHYLCYTDGCWWFYFKQCSSEVFHIIHQKINFQMFCSNEPQSHTAKILFICSALVIIYLYKQCFMSWLSLSVHLKVQSAGEMSLNSY